MSAFEVSGQTYRAGKMDVRVQFHVMRRLSPLLDSLKKMALARANTLSEAGDKAEVLDIIAPIAEAIGALNDADCDYILDACLACAKRKDGAGWQDVWSVSAKRTMYDDLTLPAMLQITVHVLKDSFATFFQELPSALTGATGE